MKEIFFNRNDYKSYKDLYHDICIKLEKNRFIDWRDNYKDLGYSGDLLNEFLWYCHDDNNKYIFKNFDRESIRNHKTHDDYKYNIIFEVFEDFVRDYPNNKLIFKNEE